MACIETRGLRKNFGATTALDGVDLKVEEGRILGLIGPNGAGKSIFLNATLGLVPYEGDLKVLGRNPWAERDQLMREFDPLHPGYGFAQHKGYPTPEHFAAMERLGPCAIHRRGFAPVRRLIAPALF